jgi:hypothetical protein
VAVAVAARKTRNNRIRCILQTYARRELGIFGLVKRIFLVLLAFGALRVAAQIVNVEAMRGPAEHDTTEQVHGRIDGGFYLGGTQALLLKLNGSVNATRRVGDHVWYGIASANWATRLGDSKFDFERNGMLHVRYNRIYSEKITAEYFVEWQSNLPMRIARRFNAGGGPRYTAISAPGVKLYINPLLMYEYDVESFTAKTDHALRLNTYVSLDRQWDQWRWTTVAYYQPRFGRFEDIRAMIAEEHAHAKEIVTNEYDLLEGEESHVLSEGGTMEEDFSSQLYDDN